MTADSADELTSARAAFALGDGANLGHEASKRLAFTQFQRAAVLVRSGAPPIRDDDERAGLEYLLALDPAVIDEAALDEAVLRARAEALALLTEREALAQRRLDRGWRQPLDLVVPGMVVILLAVAGYTVSQRALEPDDLADGKPWSASSTWAVCNPRAGRCGGISTRILFCTNEDDNPWFRIDLGAPTSISSATIINRADDAPERAIPLVLEASDDGVTYAELARRESMFSMWRPSFPRTTTRFVRVRVARKSWLHLEAVKLHR